jgi:hypothetical protein
MTAPDRIHPAALLAWLVLLIGLPAFVAHIETRPRSAAHASGIAAVAVARRPATPPPPVEPVRNYDLDPVQARDLNAAIPFSVGPNPAARPFVFAGSDADLARATDCLAAAQLYEAGDDATGERAVAQVVLNRVRHPAFPRTVCGVVFQGQERATGCQFTFTCDGALARDYSESAWDRARSIANAALAGQVYKPVGYATHYHTDWVVPYWSGSLDKIAAVGTHLFFRWRGWWGTPPAFRRSEDAGEPLIARIARFSPAHRDAPPAPAAAPAPSVAAALAAKPAPAIDAGSLGKSFGAARLVAMAPDAKSFLVELNRAAPADSWPALAQAFCAGRAQCRIMAWRSGMAPTGLPLTQPQMDAMAFAYIHNVGAGLQRSLWNCAQTPRSTPGECMRQRVPAAAAPAPPANPASAKAAAPVLEGVRRKERFETVKITPMASPDAP